ncbi:hypothetical protein GQ457_01G023100 [Hibiscus cannabinus]
MEFWAVYEGLRCAKRLNVSEVFVESDNLDVVQVLSSTMRRSIYPSLLGPIQGLVEGNWSVVLRHVFRENNRVADAMTMLFPLNTFEPRKMKYSRQRREDKKLHSGQNLSALRDKDGEKDKDKERECSQHPHVTLSEAAGNIPM